MSVITNLQPTTELEAVNAMLSAIGESPLSNLTGTQYDLVMAINTLRNKTREVQTKKWRFNTEFGYELAPTTTLSWPDTAGVTTVLNVFLPPTNLAGFELTETAEQFDLDIIIRPSRYYAPAGTRVFYDRKLNRDGLDSTKFTKLYINPIWMFDFEQMPESARRYSYVVAARQYIQEQLGAGELAKFKELDESVAWRNLMENEGQDEDLNMNTNLLLKFGRRQVFLGGRIDLRKSPNHT